jgi:hypothetical protein
MPFVDHCPWHGTKLSCICNQCGKPYRTCLPLEGPTTRCACGHDPFDRKAATVGMRSFPASSAAEYLVQHLTWCGDESRRRLLVAPAAEGAWHPALSALISQRGGNIEHTVTLPCSADRTRSWDVINHDDTKVKKNAFWPWMLIQRSPYRSVAPLPIILLHPLVKIAQALAPHFPPDIG